MLRPDKSCAILRVCPRRSKERALMKNIILPVENDASFSSLRGTGAASGSIGVANESVLRTALSLARTFGSTIEGFPLGPEIPDDEDLELPAVLPRLLDARWREEVVAAARSVFLA